MKFVELSARQIDIKSQKKLMIIYMELTLTLEKRNELKAHS